MCIYILYIDIHIYLSIHPSIHPSIDLSIYLYVEGFIVDLRSCLGCFCSAHSITYLQEQLGRDPPAGATLQWFCAGLTNFPEGPSTQYVRTLVPNAIKSMVFGTRSLKYLVLGPSGLGCFDIPTAEYEPPIEESRSEYSSTR